MVSASVSTLKGGSVNKVSLQKGARLAEIAWANNLPSINLNESVRLNPCGMYGTHSEEFR
jgi:acetyl-CoA carboxylase carboxyltransferase component